MAMGTGGAMIVVMVAMMGAMLIGVGAALWTKLRGRFGHGPKRKR